MYCSTCIWEECIVCFETVHYMLWKRQTTLHGLKQHMIVHTVAPPVNRKLHALGHQITCSERASYMHWDRTLHTLSWQLHALATQVSKTLHALTKYIACFQLANYVLKHHLQQNITCFAPATYMHWKSNLHALNMLYNTSHAVEQQTTCFSTISPQDITCFAPATYTLGRAS